MCSGNLDSLDGTERRSATPEIGAAEDAEGLCRKQGDRFGREYAFHSQAGIKELKDQLMHFLSFRRGCVFLSILDILSKQPAVATFRSSQTPFVCNRA